MIVRKYWLTSNNKFIYFYVTNIIDKKWRNFLNALKKQNKNDDENLKARKQIGIF